MVRQLRARRVAIGDHLGMDVTPDLFAPAAPEPDRCPRCGGLLEERFYGPCGVCRDALRAAFRRAARTVDIGEYEPKMNVRPNAVALKDD